MIKHLRTGGIILALVVVAGVALTDGVPLLRDHLPAIRMAFAILATVCLIWFVFISKIEPPDTALGPPKPIPGTKNESEIVDAHAAATATYDEETLGLFFQVFANPPERLVRIDEDIEPLEETPQLRIITRQQYLVGGASPRVLLFPLTRVKKGKILDDFMVRDAAGCRIPTLSDGQRRGVLAVMLQLMVDTALYEELSPMEISNARSIRDKVVRKLTLAVCGPGPLDKLNGEEDKELKTAIECALDSIKDLPLSGEWKGALQRFCEQCVDYYIIIAEVRRMEEEKDNYTTLSYSYRTPYESVAIDKTNQWRGYFGLRPSTIDIPLNPFSFEVQCYHQQIVAVPGQYVFDHHLERLGSEHQVPVRQTELENKAFKPYVRVYHDDARPNTHLYIRRQILQPASAARMSTASEASPEVADRSLRSDSAEQLKSVVQMREIPPGAMGAAAIIAFASAIVISFFAIAHTGLDINPNAPDEEIARHQIKATLNSDVPALLLALPAFVGVLIGSWLDLSRLRLASLTTYLALIGTMFLSLGSALYFVMDANHMLPTATAIPFIYGATVHTDWIWLGLMAVSITHFGFLCRTVIGELRYYAKQVKGRIDKQLG